MGPAFELNSYMPVIILMGLAAMIVILGHFVSVFLSPKKIDKYNKKDHAYECGEEPVATAWAAFSIRFYVVGLIFIIFDVESVLIFPVAAVFREFNQAGMGAIVLFEILFFVFILVAGIAYCWRKGDLDWIKSFQSIPKRKNNSIQLNGEQE